MRIFHIVFWFMCIPWGVCVKIPEAGVTRPNYGVDFNFLFPVNNMHGSWKHVWTIDLQLLDRELIDKFELNCDLDSHLCDSLNTMLFSITPRIANMTTWIHDQFNWINDPSMLATINRGTQTRVKRSLLPFIGEIEKFFFGTATESDINGIKNTIDDISKLNERTINQVSQIGDNLASLTKMMNDQIANTEAGFKLVKSTFANLTKQVNQRMNHIIDELEQEEGEIKENRKAIIYTWGLLEQIVPRIMDATKLAMADLQLISGIQQILHGYIPISLINPRALQEGLEVAFRGIRKEFPAATLSYSQDALGYYYTHQIVTPYIESNSISLIVDIPVDLKQEILYVYAIRTFPVALLPYNPYTHNIDPTARMSTAQSELSISADHFIINEDGTMWSTASALDISLCKGSVIKSCPKQFALYKFQNEHCIERIWKNMEFNAILENCPYRLSHVVHATASYKHVQVVPLSNGKWYIEAPLEEKWTITCPSRSPEVRAPCTSCVIQVDCGCGVESKYFHIPTRVSACQSVFSPLNRNFSVNPFNYLPDKQPWVINLTGDDTYTSPIKDNPAIVLPDAGQWDDVLESMDDKKLDLNKLYERQKEDLKAYKTEAEALLQKIKEQNGIIAELSNWPSWVLGLMVTLTFVNTGFIVLFILCLVSKVRAGNIQEELDWIEKEETIILSMELINCILNCVIIALLLILSGPIIMQWLKNRKMFQRFYKQQTRIKAIGYRRVRGSLKIKLSANFIFHGPQSSFHRTMPGICLLGSTPQGSQIFHPSLIDNPTLITIVEGKYRISFLKPIQIILPDDKLAEPPYFELTMDYVHRKFGMSTFNHLQSIRDVKIWIE